MERKKPQKLEVFIGFFSLSYLIKLIGSPNPPKTGKKLNKPEGKGIVKPSKGPKAEGKQKPKAGANPVARGGKATKGNTNTRYILFFCRSLTTSLFIFFQHNNIQH